MTQLKSNGMIDYKGYKIRRVANTRNWCIIKESLHLWRDGTLNALTCSHWATRYKEGLFRTLRDAKATIDGLTTTSIEDDNNEIYRGFKVTKYFEDGWYAITEHPPLEDRLKTLEDKVALLINKLRSV